MLLFLQHDGVLLSFRGFFGVLVFLEARKRDPKDNERGKEDHRNDKNIRQQTLAEAAFFLSLFRPQLQISRVLLIKSLLLKSRKLMKPTAVK